MKTLHNASILLIVVTLSTLVESAPQCATFTPLTCLHSEKVAFNDRQCHPQTCEFNAEETFKCGFPESGEYTYSDQTEGGCEDQFMSTRRRGPSPCGERCCRADHVGDFQENGLVPGTDNAAEYVFQPTDNDCRYEYISRGQVLHYLNSRGAPLLVIGDSMMRQFFLRLVMMMRGQQRLLDYHLHSHAHYSVCHEVDVFRISTSSSNITAGTPNNEHLKLKAPHFFRMAYGPGKVVGRDTLNRCSRRPTDFHYMHSPKWKNQASMLPYYLDGLNPGIKPVILTSVGYWEGSVTVPPEYLDMLTSIKDRALKIFIVSVPTVRVPTEERQIMYRTRNDFMRQWVIEAGEPFVYLDFDAMSLAPHSPPGGSLNNWHYMCSVAWRISCGNCDLVQVDHSDGRDENGNRAAAPQILQGNIERIHATDDGNCADEMNRNLWQVVFNTLLKPAKS